MKAPVTKAPKLKAKVGEIIEVPINTVGLKNVSAITLHLQFDNSILRFVKTTLADELMVSPVGASNVIPVEGTPNRSMWILSWCQIEPITQKANESLAILQFECLKAGSSPLEWMLLVNDECEYADKDALPMEEDEDSYVNGYVKVTA